MQGYTKGMQRLGRRESDRYLRHGCLGLEGGVGSATQVSSLLRALDMLLSVPAIGGGDL